MSSRAPLDHVFHALADPTRRRIVERLARGERTVMQLARRFPISQPAVTKHLQVLERAGLITRKRAGRSRPCRLRPAALRASREWIRRCEQFWHGRLDALEALLDDPSLTRE